MTKKRVLFVTQEMNPYTTLTEISAIVKKLAPLTQNKGMEVRVLMPKFGSINERRHRLHEVVRLSGMNIIVDDDDYPLIIKVASLPGSRLQVYFLDNEEFFKRKAVFNDKEEDKPFEDNQERMVFFCKGVIETVRKFGWPPDIIHCHGWMTSLIPYYLKNVYANEPIFENSNVIYSAYENEYEKTFNENFFNLAAINQLEPEDLVDFKDNKSVKLLLGGIKHADAIVKGSETLEENVQKLFDESSKPKLDFYGEEEISAPLLEFYQGLLEPVA